MLDQIFKNMTPVVKNLLILNVLFFVAEFAIPNIMDQMALYPIGTENFRPWQLATHFFMHSKQSFFHIIFNMFALVMFGTHLERVWGAQRFLVYYFATALGAALLHSLVVYLRIKGIEASMDPDLVNYVMNNGSELWSQQKNFSDPLMGQLNAMSNVPVLGASGAIFGVLVAFGYLFPNTELMLLFPPIPVKAKFLIIGYIGLELYLGFANNPHDNVAHFAHLGGALIGIILVILWQKDKTKFY
jgi:membrane associated rhomboid family serine protease